MGFWKIICVHIEERRRMVANTEGGLQRLMDGLCETASRYDMKINVKKTKTMVVSKFGGEVVNIQAMVKKWNKLSSLNIWEV
jgi:hypothetical protein